jgi:outer membrane lipoprotein LolB
VLTLDLATPLGTTLARLERDARGVRLTAPRDDGAMTTLQGTDPEALMQDAFGWAIPVDGLQHWIAGRPAPGTPAIVLTERSTNTITGIEQNGWDISIQERFAGPSGTPRRLLATRPASGPAPSLTLRLVLDEPGTPAK